MTKILCLETATEICSVAISINGQVVGLKETSDQNSHSEKLTVFIAELLEECGLSIRDIDAVAVSMGPGSYTGLRIGTSSAKGFCYALDIPLIAVSTLQAIANGAKNLVKTNGIQIIPMIDARRMEVYTATYDVDLSIIEAVRAVVVDEYFVEQLSKASPMFFCGNGALKCASILEIIPNVIIQDLPCSASFMASIAQEKFSNQQFEDVAYFEPFYLKDFIAAQSYVKGLR
jgi:tRNA threonylcarbamoyladenosine biosynthesis protein TsaB